MNEKSGSRRDWLIKFCPVFLLLGLLLGIAYALEGAPPALYGSIASFVLAAVCLVAYRKASPRSGGVTFLDHPESRVDQTQIEECWANRREPRDASEKEAQRLAGLLVAEIALYNEDLLQEGRKTGTVYGTLRADIDRSWQMYLERTEVRQPDFYLQCVVEKLCNGDPGLFGAPPGR